MEKGFLSSCERDLIESELTGLRSVVSNTRQQHSVTRVDFIPVRIKETASHPRHLKQKNVNCAVLIIASTPSYEQREDNEIRAERERGRFHRSLQADCLSDVMSGNVVFSTAIRRGGKQGE